MKITMKIKAVKWAFHLAWRFNKKILILCSVALCAASILPALALTYRQTILAALNRFTGTGEGGIETILPEIIMFGIITVLIGLSNRLNDELIYSIMFDSYYFGMEEILMDSVQKYTMEELLQKDTNDEYYACVLREGSLTDFISGFCSLLGKFAGIFSLLTVAFSVSKQIFAIAAVYITGVIWLNLLFVEKLRERRNKIKDKERLADYYENLPSMPDCAKEIRIFESQESIMTRWRETYKAIYENELKNNFSSELRAFMSGLGFYLFLAVMIVSSLFAVADGNMATDVLLVIFTLCMNIFTAVSGVARTLISTDYGLHALERQYRVFGTRAENAEDKGASAEGDGGNSSEAGAAEGSVNCSSEAGTIGSSDCQAVFRTEALSYSYKGDKPALENVSVSVNQGEIVALLGLNGSGKSTLVKLLLQIYRPLSGKIYCLNQGYDSLESEFLKNKIGAFFQDYYLFHAPVWENIGYGDIENVDDMDRIDAAMEKGQAKSFVRNLPYGSETFVQKRIVREGVDFSGGECQKLAVSRAYMSDKDIFIFDEPASMLDPVSELEQFMRIRDTVKGKTAILISHRIGFARLADKIIFMDKGKVAEVGSHQELLAKKGLYAQMFREQARWYQKETEPE